MSIRSRAPRLGLCVAGLLAACGNSTASRGASGATTAGPDHLGPLTGGRPSPWQRPAAPTAVPSEIAAAARLLEVADGYKRPVALAFAREPGQVMYVAEQGGKIWRSPLDGAAGERVLWLDLSDRITRGDGEQGLLGLALHPRWPADPRFYVNYTDKEGDTRVVEIETRGDRADLSRTRELLHVEQPASNHNGGNLSFGPDGALWVGLGDGGKAGDPWGNAQSMTSRLGKMLRIDVATGKVETAAIGLRNPWRYSFDRDTGDLYIGDVGQDKWEWIHFAPRHRLTGHNFGWNRLEGYECFDASNCDRDGLVAPIVDYSHAEGCTVVGGYVYRGKALPAVTGHYFFADYCSALIRSIRREDGKVIDHWQWRPVLDPDSALAKLSTWGQDTDGELYLASLEGVIWKLGAKE